MAESPFVKNPLPQSTNRNFSPAPSNPPSGGSSSSSGSGSSSSSNNASSSTTSSNSSSPFNPNPNPNQSRNEVRRSSGGGGSSNRNSSNSQPVASSVDGGTINSDGTKNAAPVPLQTPNQAASVNRSSFSTPLPQSIETPKVAENKANTFATPLPQSTTPQAPRPVASSVNGGTINVDSNGVMSVPQQRNVTQVSQNSNYEVGRGGAISEYKRPFYPGGIVQSYVTGFIQDVAAGYTSAKGQTLNEPSAMNVFTTGNAGQQIGAYSQRLTSKEARDALLKSAIIVTSVSGVSPIAGGVIRTGSLLPKLIGLGEVAASIDRSGEIVGSVRPVGTIAENILNYGARRLPVVSKTISLLDKSRSATVSAGEATTRALGLGNKLGGATSGIIYDLGVGFGGGALTTAGVGVVSNSLNSDAYRRAEEMGLSVPQQKAALRAAINAQENIAGTSEGRRLGFLNLNAAGILDNVNILAGRTFTPGVSQRAAIQYIQSQGFTPSQSIELYNSVIEPRIVTIGAQEAVKSLVVNAGTEVAGRNSFAYQLENLGSQSFANANEARKFITKLTVPTLATLGVAEGAAEYAGQQIIRGNQIRPGYLAFNAGLGGATSALLGGAIARSFDSLRKNAALNLLANIGDPFEAPGDVRATQIESFRRNIGLRSSEPIMVATQGKAVTISLPGQQVPQQQRAPNQNMFVQSFVSEEPEINPSLAFSIGVPTEAQTPAVVTVRTSTNTPSIIPIMPSDNVFTPDVPIPPPPIIPPSPVSPEPPVPLPVPVPVSTPVNVNFPIPVTVPNQAPFVPLPRLGAEGEGNGSSRRAGSKFYNEIADSFGVLASLGAIYAGDYKVSDIIGNNRKMAKKKKLPSKKANRKQPLRLGLFGV